MKYKLGSQIGTFDTEKFEWNLCFQDDYGNVICYVPLGELYINDEIVRKARELVKLLNKE